MGTQMHEYNGTEIAVIGMSGRFPGARTINEFWQNLQNGVESISFFSEQELLEQGNNPQLLQKPHYVRAKGFIEDVQGFDATFFDYTPKEATFMDPQFRLLHECVWEALEDAGYSPGTVKKSIGLFAGAAFNQSWLFRAFASQAMDDPEVLETATFTLRDYLCTLVSYKLDLKGPSLTIQTACSTSLVAIHQACQSLLLGECKLAAAGGVSISLPSKTGYLYQEGMINSPDGHCRSFDEKAAGTVFGDGAGIVVLKRLEEAMADGDHIYAVIRGSAINNDGNQKVGYTAPSTKGQTAVIRSALNVAEVEPESISYIEAHGTATTLGDPIEIEALKAAFRTDQRGYCHIGSVKSNIGHLNIASGVAGFIKTVLALHHRQIPPTLHFEKPNPRIDFAHSPFVVATQLTPWQSTGAPLRAGVSSFGIGGTNAHVILEQAPAPATPAPSQRDWHLLPLSAKSASALEQMAHRLGQALQAQPEVSLADVASTLQLGRAQFTHRRILLCASLDQAIAQLTQPPSNPRMQGVATQQARPLFWLFPGQGAQYVNMARQLSEHEPVFREMLDHCLTLAQAAGAGDLRTLLYPASPDEESDDRLAQTEVAQPVLFSVEYALAHLLGQWGLRPQGMLGHSIGEYVAACLAGVFSLDDAIHLVVKRGLLMSQAPHGVMVSVELSEEGIQPYLHADLSLAALNTPQQCVVSGSLPAITALEQRVQHEGRRVRRLSTSHAFHSALMDPILDAFETEVKGIALHAPKLPFLSNLTGTWIRAEEAGDASYWVRHLRQPVRFAQGMSQLLSDPDAILLEVGPGNTLSTFARQGESASRTQEVLHLIRHRREERSDEAHLLGQLGRFWVGGGTIDWAACWQGEKRQRLSLPTYPFQRQRFWLDIPTSHWTPGAPGITFSSQEQEPSQNLHAQPSSLSADTDEIEHTVSRVWEQMLGMKPDRNDSFFDIGGDSLKATTLASRLQKECNVAIQLSDVFQFTTIKALSDHVRRLEKIEYLEIVPAGDKEYYALSSSQRRTYIIQRNIGYSTTYNYPMVLFVYGTPDHKRVETAFTHLINRHEIFRTTFDFIDGEPVQKIHDQIDFSIEYADIEESAFDEYIKSFIRPFQLGQAPLLRVTCVRLTTQKYALLLDMHNILADGMSMNIFIKEFCELYKGSTLPPLSIQYKDYAEWQKRFLASPLIRKQEEYWLNMLATIPALDMPLDAPRQQTQEFSGETVQFMLSSELTGKLYQLAREHNATLNAIFYSIFTLLLHKYSGQVELVVGSLVAGRRRTEVADMIGLFTNFLPVKISLDTHSSFGQFLETTSQLLLDAYDHQDYPFDQLVEKLSHRIPRNRNPLFDAMFVYHNEYDPNVKLEVAGLRFEKYEFAKDTAKLDLKLDIVDLHNNEHRCVLQYNNQLYKKHTINSFITHFLELCQLVVDRPEWKISHINIFTPEEEQSIIAKRTSLETTSPDPAGITLVVSATFTATPIENYIKWWGQNFGYPIDVQFSAYNQVFQDLLDPSSLLSMNKGVNVLLIRFEDWLRDNNSDEQTQIQMLEQNFTDLVKLIREKQRSAPYLIGLFPPENSQKLSHTLQTYITMLNMRWEQAMSALDNVYAVDFRPLADLYQIHQVLDPVTDRTAHLPFTDEFYAALGTEVARKIAAWKQHPFKVIVLDCDNTLWQGIVGEEGPTGVLVTPPFVQLQQFMQRKRQEGFLLALCSKNNESDVWEVFSANDQMVLKPEDFVSWRLNWQLKSQNLRELATELKLGLDSFIYIDDSAVECMEVMMNCPEVLTLQLPQSEQQIPMFLSQLWALDKLDVTAEDRQRTDMYATEKHRQDAQGTALTHSDFLQGLQLKMSMNLLEEKQAIRAAQMTQRTNQFNLNTIRRNEQQIQELLAQPEMKCWLVEVEDRFGQYGITGAIFARQTGKTLFIDTFLLSCRVLGRTIEDAVVDVLIRYCLEHDLDQLVAYYYPTAKNQMVKEFLTRTSWFLERETEDYCAYSLDVQKLTAMHTHQVEIYYHTPLPQHQNQIATPAEPAQPQADEGGRGRTEPTPLSQFVHALQWNNELTSDLTLKHRAYYSPLEHSSGVLLVQLPINTVPLAKRARPYVAPRNEVEKQLCQLWTRVLEGIEVGIDDSFFEVGGNSLRAIKLEVELENYGLAIEGETIFLNPTVRQYAENLASLNQHAPARTTAADTETINASTNHLIIPGIEPFNDFIYKSCFYSSAFPIVLYLKRDIMPFLINDAIVYHYDENQPGTGLTTIYEAILPMSSILQSQGITLATQERLTDVTSTIAHSLEQGRPVVLWVDCFYESLRPDTYHRIHHPHTLLFYGYHKDKRIFNIIEHQHLESPFYEKREISFQDVEDSYAGFLQHFPAQPETYYEFIAASDWVEWKGGDLTEIFRRNSYTQKSLFTNGIQALRHFQVDFEQLVEDQTLLGQRADDLISRLSDVLNMKKVEAYKLDRLSVDQETIALLKHIIDSWNTIRTVIAKFQYSGRYTRNVVKSSREQLANVIACESLYTEWLLKQA